MNEFSLQNDEDLIASYINGDESALNHVIHNNLSLVYSVVYYMVGNKGDAEDITQETFVKIWKNINKYHQGKKFKTWLLTIARNTALDFLRKKKHYVFSDFENDDGDNLFSSTLADEGPLADEIFYRTENKKMLDEIVSKLSLPQREVITLRYTSNLTFDEIGDIVGRPLHTVKSQHRRALEQIRKHVKL